MQNSSVVEPEGARYAADLLLVHGMWARPAVWGRIAIGFAQRGWRSLLLDARAPAGEADRRGAGDLEAWCARAEEVVRSLDAPPVVVGHDAGGLVALALAARGGVRAAIAIAPLLAGPTGLVPPLQRALARWPGRGVPPPTADDPRLAALSGEARSRLVEVIETESAPLVASLRGAALMPPAPRVPTLVVAQAADALVPAALLEITARGIEAEHLVLPGGHWPMVEERVDVWTTHLHRWIVRRAGDGLLLLRGDEDLREE